jgi:ABC-type ATPase involved in cell division
MHLKKEKDHKSILDRLNLAIEEKKHGGELFFLDAPGGTGKTFVLNAFLANQRSKHRIYAVAPGAAILLNGKFNMPSIHVYTHHTY